MASHSRLCSLENGDARATREKDQSAKEGMRETEAEEERAWESGGRGAGGMYSAGCSQALCQQQGPLPVPLTACSPAVAKLSPGVGMM